jgi:hypothetical protein
MYSAVVLAIYWKYPNSSQDHSSAVPVSHSYLTLKLFVIPVIVSGCTFSPDMYLMEHINTRILKY